MGNILKKIRDRKGYTSIIILLFLAYLLPFLLFFFVEMNYLYGMKDTFQGYNDAAASAAVMQMEAEPKKDGYIVIDEVEAKNTVKKLFKENFGLNDDLTVNSQSLIKSDPMIKVYVVNHNPLDEAEEFVTDENYVYTITKSTVIVYSEVEPNGIFFNRFVKLKSLSAYEASVKEGELANDTTSNPQISDSFVLTMNRVVNPLHNYGKPERVPMEWKFNPLPMAAGANIEFSIHSVGGKQLVGADYQLRVVGGGGTYDEVVDGTMDFVSESELTSIVQIPDDAPIGSTVTLDFKNDLIVYTDNGVTQEGGNESIKFSSKGEVIGNVETNLNKLLRIQKAYTTKEMGGNK